MKKYTFPVNMDFKPNFSGDPLKVEIELSDKEVKILKHHYNNGCEELGLFWDDISIYKKVVDKALDELFDVIGKEDIDRIMSYFYDVDDICELPNYSLSDAKYAYSLFCTIVVAMPYGIED